MAVWASPQVTETEVEVVLPCGPRTNFDQICTKSLAPLKLILTNYRSNGATAPLLRSAPLLFSNGHGRPRSWWICIALGVHVERLRRRARGVEGVLFTGHSGLRKLRQKSLCVVRL